MKVKRSELVELLRNKFDGKTRIATVVAKTVPAMRKTGNSYYGRVEKLSRINVIAGKWDYQNSVNRRRDVEGHTEHFVSEPRAWGTRDRTGPFVLKDGQIHSVELKIQRVLETLYLVDAKPAKESDIVAFKAFLRQGTTDRQELDQPVIVRDYKLDSIVQLHVDGNAYVIDG